MELNFECVECGKQLEVKKIASDRYMDTTLKIERCEDCYDKAFAEGIKEGKEEVES